MLTLAFVAGARPNFPKIAPILWALQRYQGEVRALLVHTGQHYDPALSGMFFEDLGISEPDWKLGVGSGTHAVQTARVMIEFERRCLETPPDAIVVVGDVNSTVACALVGAKLQIPVIHVEAGLRSGDRSMPEEINRIVTDSIADLLYTHCAEADRNLAAEGIHPSRVTMVGNVMIDSLLRLRPRAVRPGLPEAYLKERGFGLVTLHRPALVDHKERLLPMLAALSEISADLPLIYPVHPRTLARLRDFGVIPAEGSGEVVLRGSQILLCEPIRYLQFLWLMDHARLVITDSGGIQEETTVLGVPCLTVRANTERAVTIEHGTNRLVGLDPDAVRRAVAEVLGSPLRPPETVPEGWDGRAGERLAEHLVGWLRARLAK
jgi:UDP-N-acetylglucosamine 2-epimerase (non-hydrolysing)